MCIASRMGIPHIIRGFVPCLSCISKCRYSISASNVSIRSAAARRSFEKNVGPLAWTPSRSNDEDENSPVPLLIISGIVTIYLPSFIVSTNCFIQKFSQTRYNQSCRSIKILNSLLVSLYLFCSSKRIYHCFYSVDIHIQRRTLFATQPTRPASIHFV